MTPFTQRDLEWRGLRSAAPTPDTAAIGRRFSFDWRKGSQEVDHDDGEELSDGGVEETSKNTRANAGAPEVDGGDEEVGKVGEDVDGEEGEKASAAGRKRFDVGRARRASRAAEAVGPLDEAYCGRVWMWIMEKVEG